MIFGKWLTIEPLNYYEYQSDIGKKVKINIGGFSGSSYIRTGEAGKVSAYLSLGSGTIRPAAALGGGVGVGFTAGVSFTTGSIYPLEINFGQFLTEILKKQ